MWPRWRPSPACPWTIVGAWLCLFGLGSGLEFDSRDGMHFPDHGHIRPEALWSRPPACGMGDVEEEGTVHYNGYRGIIEIVPGTGKVSRAEERLERVPGRLERRERGAARRRQTGHSSSCTFRERAGLATEDQVIVAVVLLARCVQPTGDPDVRFSSATRFEVAPCYRRGVVGHVSLRWKRCEEVIEVRELLDRRGRIESFAALRSVPL